MAFNYTLAIRDLCVDVCKKTPEFANFDMSYVGFSFNRARNIGSRFGNWASVTPLRFQFGLRVSIPDKLMPILELNAATVKGARDGDRIEIHTNDKNDSMIVLYGSETSREELVLSSAERRNLSLLRFHRTPKVVGDGKELLYLFSIMLPRFYELSSTEKLETIMHELYHISEAFDGDVRRFPGRNWQHGSKKLYQARSEKFARDWLAKDPDPALFNFLQYNSAQLIERYGSIMGGKYPRIKTYPISLDEAFKHEPRLVQFIAAAQAKGRLK